MHIPGEESIATDDGIVLVSVMRAWSLMFDPFSAELVVIPIQSGFRQPRGSRGMVQDGQTYSVHHGEPVRVGHSLLCGRLLLDYTQIHRTACTECGVGVPFFPIRSQRAIMVAVGRGQVSHRSRNHTTRLGGVHASAGVHVEAKQ